MPAQLVGDALREVDASAPGPSPGGLLQKNDVGVQRFQVSGQLVEIDLLFGHLGMQHAGPGGHPLHTTGSNHPFVTHMIPVAHAPGFHISDGFETTVRVLWKTPDVIGGIVRVDLINHQVGVEYAVQTMARKTMYFYPITIAGLLCIDNL